MPAPEPTRAEIDATEGSLVLEFGATWCAHCRTLAPHLTALLERHRQVRHWKVEDGPGLLLGRSFRVKLWPTLVFLRDGRVVDRMTRPDPDQLRSGLEAIAGPLAQG